MALTRPLNGGLFLSPPAHVVSQALYLCAEDPTLIHQNVDVCLTPILEPSQCSQGGMMVVKAPTVPIPSGIKQCCHGLLVDSQVGNHSFDPGYPHWGQTPTYPVGKLRVFQQFTQMIPSGLIENQFKIYPPL